MCLVVSFCVGYVWCFVSFEKMVGEECFEGVLRVVLGAFSVLRGPQDDKIYGIKGNTGGSVCVVV